MLTVLVALFLGKSTLVATIDPSITSMVNTLMNAAMLVYLARLDRNVTPTVRHIESEIDTRKPGGSRRHDPSDNGDAERP